MTGGTKRGADIRTHSSIFAHFIFIRILELDPGLFVKKFQFLHFLWTRKPNRLMLNFGGIQTSDALFLVGILIEYLLDGKYTSRHCTIFVVCLFQKELSRCFQRGLAPKAGSNLQQSSDDTQQFNIVHRVIFFAAEFAEWFSILLVKNVEIQFKYN